MKNIELLSDHSVPSSTLSERQVVDDELLDSPAYHLGEFAITIEGKDVLAERELAPDESLVAELQAVPERLHERIDRAIETCEFVRSPELEQAIADYYIDHTRLAAVVERIIDQTISQKELSELVEGDGVHNFAMHCAMDALLSASDATGDRETSLYIAEQITTTVLFREVCVGATTITETERQQVAELETKLRRAAIDEGIAFQAADGDMYWSRSSTPGVMRGKFIDAEQTTDLTSTQERFWEDSRFAGQLLFHNTPFMGEVAKSGFKLSSRTHRAEKDGFYDTATGVFEGSGYAAHTNVIHWSEEFMTDEYKVDNKDTGRTDERARHPATIAVPLAEIIKTAPYARDGQYGELQLKSDASANVTVNDTVRIAAESGYWPNTGENDVMGRSGKDRTFFADNRVEHAKEAHDYVLDAGVGMATEEGNLSKILLLQRDLDRIEKAKFGEGDASYQDRAYYGAGYGYPGTTVLAYDLDTYPAANRAGEKNLPDVAPDVLQKFHVNPAYVLDQRTANEHRSYRADALTAEQQMTELRTQISEMQRASRESDRYAHKVIVPLRQGVVEFSTEGRHGTELDTFAPAFNRKTDTGANIINSAQVAIA